MTVDWLPVAVSVIALIGLLLARVPIAYALTAAALAGYVLLADANIAQANLASLPFSVLADYNLVLVPMFMAMGLLASAGGILTAVFDLAERLLRRLPGGLAVAATMSAGFLGGISGSSVADTATLGRVTTQQMHRRGYDLSFAAAVVASSNTVAILIPPSLALVLIGVVSEQPIGPLLLAGLVPGIITVIAYAACCIFMAKHRPSTVFTNASGRESNPGEQGSKPDWIVSFIGVGAGLVLMLVVLGGLYSGILTATEAGFAGAATALVLAIVLISARRRRLGEGRYADLGGALTESAQLTGVVFLLLIGATLFSNFLILAGVPDALTTLILDTGFPDLAVLALFLVLTLLLGMVLDPLAILLIVAPIAFPVVDAMGHSQIWFAILFVKSIEIGLLTPPVGMNAFVVASVNKGLKVEQVFARLVPFIATEFVVLILLFFIPAISTWLPASA